MILPPVLGKADWIIRWFKVSERFLTDAVKVTHLQHANGNIHGNAGTSHRPSVVCDRPGIPGETLDDLRQLELACLYGHEEAARCSLEASSLAEHRRTRGCRARRRGIETEHVYDLLLLIVLRASEDV
jgi:hypothetical protein